MLTVTFELSFVPLVSSELVVLGDLGLDVGLVGSLVDDLAILLIELSETGVPFLLFDLVATGDTVDAVAAVDAVDEEEEAADGVGCDLGIEALVVFGGVPQIASMSLMSLI